MEQQAGQHSKGQDPAVQPAIAAIAEAAKSLSTELAGMRSLDGVLAKPVKELRAQLQVIKDGNEPVLTLAHAEELAGLGYAELRMSSTFELSAAERVKLAAALKRLPGLEARNRCLNAELVESNRELSGFFSSIGLFLRGERAIVKRLLKSTIAEIGTITQPLTEARRHRDEVRAKEQNLASERGKFGFIDETGIRLTAAGEKLFSQLAAHPESCRDLAVGRFLEAAEHVRGLTVNRIQRIRSLAEDPAFTAVSWPERRDLAFNLSFYPGSHAEIVNRYEAFASAVGEQRFPPSTDISAVQQLFFKSGAPADLITDTVEIFDLLVKRGAASKANTFASAAMIASTVEGRFSPSERINERQILVQFLKEAPARGRHPAGLIEYIASQLLPLAGTGKERVQQYMDARTALVETGFRDDANTSVAALSLLRHPHPLAPIAARSREILSKLDAVRTLIKTEALYGPAVRLALLPGTIERHLQSFDQMRHVLFEENLEGGENEYAARAVALLRGVGQDAFVQRSEEILLETAARNRLSRADVPAQRQSFANDDEPLPASPLSLNAPCSASSLVLFLLFDHPLNSRGDLGSSLAHGIAPDPSAAAPALVHVMDFAPASLADFSPGTLQDFTPTIMEVTPAFTATSISTTAPMPAFSIDSSF